VFAVREIYYIVCIFDFSSKLQFQHCRHMWLGTSRRRRFWVDDTPRVHTEFRNRSERRPQSKW